MGHNHFDGTQESHFYLILKNKGSNVSKLFIHRKVNDLLKDEFKSGLHALEIKIQKN